MAVRKTTLMLDDSLITEYKIRAAREGRSLSSMVAEAMRTYDPKKEAKSRPEKWELLVLGSGKPTSDLYWSSNAAMWEYLEGDLPIDKQR